jgi:hypothetical protein
MATQIAAGLDSSGTLNVVVLNQNGQPYLITQDPMGGWHSQVALPIGGRTYSSVAAAAALGSLQFVLIDQQHGQPYVTQIGPGITTQAPAPFTFINNGALPSNVTFTSVATGYDSFNNVLFVFLIADTQIPPQTSQDNVFVLSQPLNGNWSALGNISDLTGQSEGSWLPANLGPAANGPGFYSGCAAIPWTTQGLFFVLLLEGAAGSYPVIIYEVAPKNWVPVVLPTNYPADYYFPAISSPACIATGVGNAQQLQVVFIGMDGNAHLWWDDIQGNWHFDIPTNPPQYNLPTPSTLSFSAVAMGTGHDSNKLQVILLAGGMPWLVWQDTDGQWNWHDQLPVGKMPAGLSSFSEVVAAIGNDSNKLQVLLLGNDGNVYLIWQDVTGAWHPYVDPNNNMLSLSKF